MSVPNRRPVPELKATTKGPKRWSTYRPGWPSKLGGLRKRKGKEEKEKLKNKTETFRKAVEGLLIVRGGGAEGVGMP